MKLSVSREVAVSLSFLLFGAGVFYSIYSIEVVEGVNAIYTHIKIVPNFVSAVLFDWRGFDTLGECLILINSVLVTGIVFGKGLFNWDFLKEVYGEEKCKDSDLGFTPIVKVLAVPMGVLLMALGILVILGGHITPGGGFQGGALISAAYVLAMVAFGVRRCPIRFTYKFLESLESFGALLFLILGLLGMVLSGYYLYNIREIWGIPPFPSPPGVGDVGIIPYLNIGVGLKVLAGLSTITVLLLSQRIISKNIGKG
ncbi:MAG TPA: cation:proton antiporter [Methanothermococcus okinawensis]|uniref:Cation:proton antiporter n=1 Tax=Methanothermococcus okinawensis TaxID=155863 RepID=A0A833E1H7_9EURY|nr:cation:proton antiporter [Methanococcaceae archaeon]HIP84126.1 cation:proton antiporter [Methanothermococcus okinawensis]HIP91672.1 cation:proton antiporter [Methanothermococcus okinawensis]